MHKCKNKKWFIYILLISLIINTINFPNEIYAMSKTITDTGYIDCWTNSSGNWITSKDMNGNSVRPIPAYAGGGNVSYTFKIPVPSEYVGKISKVEKVEKVEYDASSSYLDNAVKPKYVNVSPSYNFGDNFVMFTVNITKLESIGNNGEGLNTKQDGQAELVQGRRFYVPTKITFQYTDTTQKEDTINIKYVDKNTNKEIISSLKETMRIGQYNNFYPKPKSGYTFEYWKYNSGISSTEKPTRIHSDGTGSNNTLIFYYSDNSSGSSGDIKAVINAPSTVAENTPFKLSGSNSYTNYPGARIISYTWEDLNKGKWVSSSESWTHIGISRKTTFKLTVRDNLGHTASATHTVTIGAEDTGDINCIFDVDSPVRKNLKDSNPFNINYQDYSYGETDPYDDDEQYLQGIYRWEIRIIHEDLSIDADEFTIRSSDLLNEFHDRRGVSFSQVKNEYISNEINKVLEQRYTTVGEYNITIRQRVRGYKKAHDSDTCKSTIIVDSFDIPKPEDVISDFEIKKEHLLSFNYIFELANHANYIDNSHVKGFESSLDKGISKLRWEIEISTPKQGVYRNLSIATNKNGMSGEAWNTQAIGAILSESDTGTLMTTLWRLIENGEKEVNVKITQYASCRIGNQEIESALPCVKTINFSKFAPPEQPKNAPKVSVSILERDADPSTSEKLIYLDESLLFKTEIESEEPIKKVEWKTYKITQEQIDAGVQLGDGELIESGIDEVNGLKQMVMEKYTQGYYYLMIEATNTQDKTGMDSATFTVRNPQPPVISITTNLDITDNPEENIRYATQNISIATVVKEYNKSEQHPNGFGIRTRYAIRNSKDNSIVNGYNQETIANIDTLISENNLKPINAYIFNQYAQLDYDKFTDYNALRSLAFKVNNMKPIVTLNTTKGDNINPVWAKEKVIYEITAKDLDGTIEKVNIFLDGKDYKTNSNQNYKLISEEIIQGIGESTYKAKITYTGIDTTTANFKVVAYDNFDASDEKEDTLNVVKPTITTKVDITNEDSIQKKENRYIQFNNINAITNSVFPLDKSKSIWEYKTENGRYITVSNQQSYEDEYIRIYFPNFPQKDVMDTYFKQTGKYYVRDKEIDTVGFNGEWYEKEVTIIIDRVPTVDVKVESSNNRITEDDVNSNTSISDAVIEGNIGKGYFKITETGKSDDNDKLRNKKIYVTYDADLNGQSENDIKTVTTISQSNIGYSETEEIVVETNQDNNIKVQNLEKFNITFLTSKNALGNYYIAERVQEQITQLPSNKNNPLYDEILTKELSCISEYIQAEINNIAPNVKFNIVKGRKATLMIQFDHEPTEEELQKIKQIEDGLTERGIDVEIIKQFNTY